MVYLYVGIAGIIGAVLRFVISNFTNQWWHFDFPMATLLINLAGCFILGWFTTFIRQFKNIPPSFSTAIGTGLIGSFTTFSTFSVETVELMLAEKWGQALFYVLMSFWGGLSFAWFGFKLGKVRREG